MKRLVSAWIIIVFIVSLIIGPQQGHAEPLNLPMPGTMVNLSPAYVPVIIKGLRVHPENPLLFDFILDSGNSGLAVNSPAFKAESEKLIKYFMASLTIKEDDLWVNLSPYEKDRIIPKNLGRTELGQDMLAQDYILKQLTASLIYPEKQLGKEFWNRVYTKAQLMFGTSQVPVNTFNKVWIVADRAKILERNNAAYVVGSHLKVMLEEDYMALEKHSAFSQAAMNQTHSAASQVVREIIVPELEKEVNQGKNFAPLRQMFYSMILATWYKLSLKNALLNQVYSNKGKMGGVLADDPNEKEKIFEQYLKAYKKGVFNFIKEDMDTASKQMVPRKYFSGGEDFRGVKNMERSNAMVSLPPGIGRMAVVTVATIASFLGLTPPAKAQTPAIMLDSLVDIPVPGQIGDQIGVGGEKVSVINGVLGVEKLGPSGSSIKYSVDLKREVKTVAVNKDGQEGQQSLETAFPEVMAQLLAAKARSQGQDQDTVETDINMIGALKVNPVFPVKHPSSITFSTTLLSDGEEITVSNLAGGKTGYTYRVYFVTEGNAHYVFATLKEGHFFKDPSPRSTQWTDLLNDVIALLQQDETPENITQIQSLIEKIQGAENSGPITLPNTALPPPNEKPENREKIPAPIINIHKNSGPIELPNTTLPLPINNVAAALKDPGGIDLNAKNMGLDITREGNGIVMKFDPLLIAQFQRGDFSGIKSIIIRITPVQSALQIFR